ncbi:MAG: 5-amino-6-(D-ribitylamino)uracil--L-tyrosine 4-hydroxyphenyl transferase CofH [Candidatus Heimdallarchaeota archaeon]|nr:MAG: 5-amino-6-(D-ribitylamino)uracil--L-tyrosine 4-hydroxyphenyl transferase CofH [Candidatus Heimdallarchaeota archaeon]
MLQLKDLIQGRLSKTARQTDLEDVDLRKARRKLRNILKQALNDEIPTIEELSILFSAQGHEIHLLGQVADVIRERQVGSTITYVVNRNINFTNVCSNNCLFCAYSVPPDSKDGYFDISIENFRKKIEKTYPYQITEVCVQGGIHPALNFDTYIEILQNLKGIDPTLHIHAFSPQEITHAANSIEEDVEEVLREFKKHGLGSIPGTAAEILDDNVRKAICPHKLSSAEWIHTIELCHQLGIPTTATILFGHIEGSHHWVRHLSILRMIQEKTHGFTEFIPLPFIAENTQLKQKHSFHKLSNLDYIKFYAVSRLFLGDLFKNIQTSWVKLGFPMAQITLKAGCNDFGGTLFEENITRSAGGVFGQIATPEKFQMSIHRLQRTSCERGTLYNLLC